MNKYNVNFLAGLLIIIIGFLLFRLPYFFWMPITNFDGDAVEYYNILEALRVYSDSPIYYPTIGYPLFLRICELILNKSIFVVFAQSLLQLFSVLLLFYSVKIVLNKYIIFISVILLGYLTSNLNLYYDSSIYPDSLLSSLYIIYASFFILTMKYKSLWFYSFLSLIIAFSISVRASAVILIPSFLCLLIFNIYQSRNLKIFLMQLLPLLVFVLIFSSFNYFSPLYKTFGIIVNKPSEQKEVLNTYPSNIKDKFLNQLALLLNHPGMNNILIYNNTKNPDSLFTAYRWELQRGVKLFIKKDSLYYQNSEWAVTNLDAFAVSNNKNYYQYTEYKNYFKIKFAESNVYYNVDKDLELKKLLFVYFFKYFYKTVQLNGYTMGFENKDFYSQNLRGRYWSYYVQRSWINWAMTKDFYVTDRVVNRTCKEYWTDDVKTLDDLDNVCWVMKSSRYYRWIIAPFYRIQPILFRNFLFPILFIFSFSLSLIGLFFSQFRERLFLVVFCILSLLILTNLIHSVILSFLYLRYTYQVSFVYYLSVAFMPMMLNWFYKNVKRKEVSTIFR
jgi:hypothetical protein